MIPKIIDNRYEIIKEIGSGGFGHIYLVTDRKTKQTVALKTLNPPQNDSKLQKYFIHSFKNEFATLIRLEHPHLCRVYDYGYDKKRNEYYFTEELIDGKNLLEATHTLTFAECEQLFVQACRALEYIHSHGIVHFDIKPANILVMEEEGAHQIKVIDFGLAQLKAEQREATAGTLRYMAPEMLAKNVLSDHRSDLYALGLVFYEVFSRHYPFNAVTQVGLMKAHKNDVPAPIRQFNAALPEYLPQIFDRLLAKDPADRFYHANSVIRAINLHSDMEYPLETKQTLSSYTFSSELIGRSNILDALKKNIAQPKNIFSFGIFGDNGLGKSRILKEIKSTAQLQQIPHLEIHRSEEFWDSLLSERVQATTDDKELLIQQCVTTLLKPLHTPPLLVLLDDWHLLEPLLQEVLIRALTANRGHFIFLWTLNPEETDKTFLSRLKELERAKKSLEFSLLPFSKEEVRHYLEEFLGVTTVPPDTIEQLHTLTGGNPYFLQETLKAWIAKGNRGRRATQELQWKEIVPTANLETLITQTLKRIQGDGKTVFELLATHGKPLQPEVLQTLSELSPGDFQRALEELLAQQVIQPSGARGMEVANTLLKNIAFEKMSKGRREKYHHQLFKYLQTHDGVLEDLAFHAAHLPADSQRLHYILKAAEQAEIRLQYGQALDWYQKLLTSKKPPMTAETIGLKIANLQSLLGRYAEAKSLLMQILDQNQEKKDRTTALALRRLGWLLQKEGEQIQALDTLQKSLKIFEALDDTYQIVVSNDIGHHYVAQKEWEKAVHFFEKSAKHLEAHPNLEYAQNNQLALVYQALGRTEAARDFAQKKLGWALNQNNSFAIALSYSELGQLHLESGHYEEAKKYYQMSLKLLRPIGSPHRFKVLNDLLSIAQNESLYGEAIQYLEEILAEQITAHDGLIAGTLYSSIGLFHKAEQYLNESQKIYDQQKNFIQVGWVCLMRGYLKNGLGQWEEAGLWFTQALTSAQKYQDKFLEVHAHLGLGDTYFWGGKKEEAAKQLEEARPLIQNLSDPELRFRILLLEGLLHMDGPVESATLLQEENLEHRFETFDLLTRHALQHGEMLQAAQRYQEGLDVVAQMIQGLPEAYQESFKLQPRIQRFIQLMAKPAEIQSPPTGATLEEMSGETKPVQK